MINFLRLGIIWPGLWLQIARKLHAHENPGGEKWDDDENETHRRQQDAIQLRLSWCVRLVHDDEAKSANREEETAG